MAEGCCTLSQRTHPSVECLPSHKGGTFWANRAVLSFYKKELPSAKLLKPRHQSNMYFLQKTKLKLMFRTVKQNLKLSSLLEHLQPPSSFSAFPDEASSPLFASVCLAGDSAAYQRTNVFGDDMVIVAAHRIALCKAKFGGFKDTHLDDLLAAVLKAMVEKTNLNPGEVGDIVVGMVLAPGTLRATEYRMASFYAGFPDTVPIRSGREKREVKVVPCAVYSFNHLPINEQGIMCLDSISLEIESLKKRLTLIRDDRQFHLEAQHREIQIVYNARDHAHSFMSPKDVIIGRDDDRTKILQILLETKTEESVLVVPIVVSGGLGKTILARFVLNNEKNRELWLNMRSLLLSDADGSRIIVTACRQEVARLQQQ
ncbi:hypothetical protein FNV43_RR05717 [Rhamnella rubrinervis]|uniref:Thiolase N-terminal domain-containing protein n=1 Tax=Rhamnella rubrinervis TaxID=2594499 RepID=A0A8K0MRD4_9ROSA|nr:hypothetical protein FNV43_RR05717 [Rhamnella rubrinervis]